MGSNRMKDANLKVDPDSLTTAPAGDPKKDEGPK
jgi:hypothetical protein